MSEKVDVSGRSRWVWLTGPVHYLDYGGPDGAPVIVAVHGLGGSALNWAAIAPRLTDRYRLLAPDLAGHGRTRAGDRSTSVRANRRLLHQFIETVSGAPVVLMGNSMGGMISLLQAGREPATTAALVLLDAATPFVPAMPDPVVAVIFGAYAMPLLGRAIMNRRRAMSPERAVGLVLKLCCVDPGRVPPAVVAAHVELARQRAGFPEVERDFLRAARSVVTTAGGPPRRSYREAIHAVRAPTLLVHGGRDRLVPTAASRALARSRDDWQLHVIPDVGHVPQLEAPAETAAIIRRWCDATPAVRAAAHPLAG